MHGVIRAVQAGSVAIEGSDEVPGVKHANDSVGDRFAAHVEHA